MDLIIIIAGIFVFLITVYYLDKNSLDNIGLKKSNSHMPYMVLTFVIIISSMYFNNIIKESASMTFLKLDQYLNYF